MIARERNERGTGSLKRGLNAKYNIIFQRVT
jgi:hypothetical protein